MGQWVASSYRQLPVCIYHFQTKFRDEPRPRGGLLRVREFTMKDAYSFDTDLESQEATYQDFMTAYLRAFRRCGIEPAIVESDAGAMQGSGAHEFHCLTEAGEDTLVVSASGRYAANIEIAKAQKPVFDHGEPQPVEKVATPGQETIDAVAAYLGVETHQTLKAVFYWTGDALAFVAIRGDLQVNEAKLRSLLQAPRPAPGRRPGTGSCRPGRWLRLTSRSVQRHHSRRRLRRVGNQPGGRRQPAWLSPDQRQLSARL